VRAEAALELRQRFAVRLDDREPDVNGSAGGDRRRGCEADEVIGLRGADGDLGRRRAAAAPGQEGGERDSVEGVPVPVPIGPGPQYQPRPAIRGSCRAAPLRAGKRVHLELFGRGFAVVIPARIGVRGSSCRARTWTTDPTGVVRFDRSSTLGDLFAVWGMPLTRSRLLSFHGDVRGYRNGVRVRGDPRAIPLRDLDELVLEIGPYVSPHRSYRFPR
jgi:hypothetical protein